MTPAALDGRWRVITSPAVRTLVPCARSATSRALRTRSSSSLRRSNASGWRPRREPQVPVVRGDVLASRWAGAASARLPQSAPIGKSRWLLHTGHIPARAMAVARERPERPGRGKRSQILRAERALSATSCDIGRTTRRGAPRPTACPAPSAESPLTAVSPSRNAAAAVLLAPLQRAVPAAVAHVDRPHLDAVLARDAHELLRRIKPHRLAVQQRAAERRGLVMLEPRRDVHQQREARGVRLRETVFAESFDLAEDPLRELLARSRARSCRRSAPLETARARRCAATPPSRGAADRLRPA